MAVIGTLDLEMLASIITEKIAEEFQIKHLSRNLMATVQFQAEKDKIEVIIPARLYDLAEYRSKGVVVYKSDGSYASRLDNEGSFAGNHKDFVERIINQSITEWLMVMRSKKIKGDIVSK